MAYACYDDHLANSIDRYDRDKGYFKSKFQRWKAKNPKRYAFLGQRHTCKQRGIHFGMTFNEWVKFWGDDFHRRGRRMNDLQMCRYDDIGAYVIGNVYKATNMENKAGPRTKDEGLHEDIPY